MNSPIKILFGTLFLAVALVAGNAVTSGDNTDYDAQHDNGTVTTQNDNGGSSRGHKDDGGAAASTKSDAKLLVTKIQRGANISEKDIVSLKRAGYIAAYNPATKIPVWVAWNLTNANCDGPYKREGQKFTADMDVPAPRAEHLDYVNSGYDRGHMCPSADCRWSEEAQQQSFLLTNICPQLHNLNAGDWKELEERCRTWAEEYGSIYIVSGPILLNKRHKTIGKNKITVPEAFFKVVLRTGKKPAAIGFIYRNEKANKKMSAYVNSVDEVERITGLDFFSSLPDNIENKVEAKADLSDWK